VVMHSGVAGMITVVGCCGKCSAMSMYLCWELEYVQI
jgi:hypothetical protein